MWESRTKDPRGRLSTRKWLRAATSLFVALFGYLLINTTPVYGLEPADQPQTTQQTQTGDEEAATTQEDVKPAASSTSGDTSSCKVDGVGWIICSMSRWIADGVDYLYSILTNFFIFTPLATSGDDNSMYQLWGTVRNIANIAFMIAFMIIIYAQITGGFILSNYTIKRLLPRVIVAAILVNTSYWICAIAIDISNILGVAVQDMFTSFRESIGPAAKDFPKWTDVTGGILGGTGIVLGGGALLAATGGTVGGLAFLLLGALLPAIFAALVAVAILAARQALITLFVIIAPLAFVAYLLPNTEEWFNRWRKLFTTMLVMFPAFSFIFGASQVAGVIVIQNAKDISVALLGLTIQVVPLFITPFLIKLSSGLLGTIAGMANNRSKGIFDRTGNWAKANREMHRQRGFSKKPTKLDGRGRVRGLRPTTLAQRVNNRTLRREGLTEAHRSKATAQFAETRAGRQIYGRRKDAELRQHAADGTSQEAWAQSVYGTPGVAGSGSTHRRHLHHAGHMAGGRAKLIEDNAMSYAERDLQEQVLATRSLRKMVVDTNEQTQRGELAKAVVQARADAQWNNLSNSDAALRNLKLNQQVATQSAKKAEEQWNTMLANINAMGGAAPNLRVGEARLADSIRSINEGVTIEGYARANAETEMKSRLTTTLLENTKIVAGKTVREYAGGIRADAGAESVLASAVAASRKEYGERIGEKAELVKHFNLSSEERQDLAMGRHNITKTKDGATYVFKTSDDYVREAVVDEQLGAGSFSQIEELVKESGVGGLTHDYRTTISQAIVQKGLTGKALYFGAKMIDDVAQGKLLGDAGLDDAVVYHIKDGKIKDEVLASQAPDALKRIFEVAASPTRSAYYASLSPTDQATFLANARDLPEAAKRILADDILRTRVDSAAHNVFELYKAP